MTFQSIAGPRFLPAVFMATVLLCGCAGSGANAGAESWLRGEAILEKPAPMPRDAQLIVRLVDVTRANLTAPLLGEVRINNPVTPPFEFAIRYDPAGVDPASRYALEAEIRVAGRPMMRSIERVPVLTGSDEKPTVVMAQVAARAGGYDTAGLDERANTIDANIDNYEMVSGTLSSGDVQADYRAWLDHDAKVVRIDELYSLGEYGQGRARYVYRENRVFLATQQARRRMIGGPRDGELYDSGLQIYFDDNGRFMSGTFDVDGNIRDVDEHQVRGAARHADLLRAEAIALKTIEPPTLQCQGNEPFWNITVEAESAEMTRLGESPQTFAGRFTRLGGSQPRAFEWQGEQQGMAGNLYLIATQRQCLDTMSDETPPFGFDARLRLPNNQMLQGCCRMVAPGAR